MAEARAHLDWLSGALSGSANIVVGFPFDVVKVRLQTAIGSYPGAWHCFKNILKYEGVRGLYRGQTPQLLGGAIETGINYAVYRSMLEVCAGAGSAVPGSLAIPLSAGVAGLALSFVLSPAELIKCRLQLGSTDPLHGSYKGPIDCLRHLLRTEGWRKGLWRGLGATAAREVPGNIIYFTSYSTLRQRFPGRADAHQTGQHRTLAQHVGDAASAIVCGGVAGMILWTCVLPLDAAKTRIQVARPGTPFDTSIARQLAAMYREGGIARLYFGLRPTLLRAFPANAAQWLAWECCQDYLYRGGGGGGGGG